MDQWLNIGEKDLIINKSVIIVEKNLYEKRHFY
jgi:hypothetical protein